MCLSFLSDYETNTLKIIKRISDNTLECSKLNTFIDLQYYLIENLNNYNSIITNNDTKLTVNTQYLILEYCMIRYLTKDSFNDCINTLNTNYNISYYCYCLIQKYFILVFDNNEIDILNSFCKFNRIIDNNKIKQLIYTHYINKKLKKLINLY
jgi:hypothetical protein